MSRYLNLNIKNEIEKMQIINVPLCCDDEYSLDISRLEEKYKNQK